MEWPRDKYRRAAEAGMTVSETAKMCGVTPQAVKICAKKHGIVFKNDRVRPDADELISMFHSGMTFAEIAKAKKIEYHSLQSFFSYRGIKARDKPVRHVGPYPDPKDKKRIHPEEIKARFGYCPKTGVVRDKANAGRPVGYVDSAGYISIYYKGLNLKAHRIAWVVYYGGWPNDVIDHINGVKSDNRIENLRDVTQSENGRAAREMQMARSREA